MTAQRTERLVNPETMDVLVEHAHRARKQPHVYAYERLAGEGEAGAEDKPDAEEVGLWNELIGNVEEAVMQDLQLGEDVKDEERLLEKVI